MEVCSKLREQVGGFSFRKDWFQAMLEYACDRLREDELLKVAGASKWNQCEAHFFIGLNRLADADRAGAREHFQQAVDTRVFYSFDHDWSRTFLKRLEKDPTWPAWIPRNRPPAERTTQRVKDEPAAVNR